MTKAEAMAYFHITDESRIDKDNVEWLISIEKMRLNNKSIIITKDAREILTALEALL